MNLRPDDGASSASGHESSVESSLDTLIGERGESVCLPGPGGALRVRAADDGWVLQRDDGSEQAFAATLWGRRELALALGPVDDLHDLLPLLCGLLRERARNAGVPVDAICARFERADPPPILFTRAFCQRRGLLQDLLTRNACVAAVERLTSTTAQTLQRHLEQNAAYGLRTFARATVDDEVDELVRWRDQLAYRGHAGHAYCGRASHALHVLLDRFDDALTPRRLQQLPELPLPCPPRSYAHVEAIFAVDAAATRMLSARERDGRITALIERVLRTSEPDLAAARLFPGDPVVLSYDELAAFVVAAPPGCKQALPAIVRRQREQARRNAAQAAAHRAHLVSRAAAQGTSGVEASDTPSTRSPRGLRGTIAWSSRGKHPLLDADLPAPLLPPPADTRVRWLGTRKALHDEGRQMHHCVFQYVDNAVDGDVVFFHVEHAGEHATVEVDRHGEVVACHGPHNEHNAACDVATVLLSAWAAPLRQRQRLLPARPARLLLAAPASASREAEETELRGGR